MVVSSHEKPRHRAVSYLSSVGRCIRGAHGASHRACVDRRGKEREREREGTFCATRTRRYAAARRSVSAFRLPQCALYSPTLKESHALTSSCCLLCASATEEDPKSAAETNQVRGHFTGRPLTRRFHANRCDRGPP